MIITMYVEEDLSYQFTVPDGAKEVDLALLSPEDGWYVNVHGKKVPLRRDPRDPRDPSDLAGRLTMATTLGSIEGDLTGRIVYEFAAPQTLGRIMEYRPGPPSSVFGRSPGNNFDAVVRVRWFKPIKPHRTNTDRVSEQVRPAHSLQDFESLVLETEKKARKHRAALEKAKAEP